MATIEKTLITNLTRLIDRFTAATEISKSAIGVNALNDHKWVGRALGGASFSVRSYDRVIGYLAANWPDEVDWPESIPRPSGAEIAETKRLAAKTSAAA
jgi:hypothetical protein